MEVLGLFFGCLRLVLSCIIGVGINFGFCKKSLCESLVVWFGGFYLCGPERGGIDKKD